MKLTLTDSDGVILDSWEVRDDSEINDDDFTLFIDSYPGYPMDNLAEVKAAIQHAWEHNH